MQPFRHGGGQFGDEQRTLDLAGGSDHLAEVQSPTREVVCAALDWGDPRVVWAGDGAGAGAADARLAA
jgi:hypothetical protein